MSDPRPPLQEGSRGTGGVTGRSDPSPPLQEGSRGTGGVTGHEGPEPALTRGLTRHWRCHWPGVTRARPYKRAHAALEVSLARSDPSPPLQEGSRGTGGVTGHEGPEAALTRGLTRHWRCHWP
ncbi:hypothetical protein NDU88_012189 [Pleurodeles waltl]|uniref:Uncharacterized protein n=1 Tax=Pleurodeles waltl TaxID=8319 RepID=A0AAV7QZY5_PLEWA|nr:hypothetical protein NDU88_012189 [Pleurodeles waltl]